MNINGIFAVVEGALYAIQFDDNQADEFKQLFDNWQDPEFLEQFFEDNKDDLQRSIYKHFSVEQAVIRTIDESTKFERKILAAAKQTNPYAAFTLENAIFHPLHKDVLSNDHIESKAYGTRHRSWLRIYAIRLSENIYFVSGGGIKLTKSNSDSEHLKTEMVKLKKVKEYLKKNFIGDEGDLGYIELLNND
jgi:hypothetical protein